MGEAVRGRNRIHQSGIHSHTHTHSTCYKVRHQYASTVRDNTRRRCLQLFFHFTSLARSLAHSRARVSLCECVLVYAIRHYFFSSPLRCFEETFWNRIECVRPYTVCAEWNPFYCLVERTACSETKKNIICFSFFRILSTKKSNNICCTTELQIDRKTM